VGLPDDVEATDADLAAKALATEPDGESGAVDESAADADADADIVIAERPEARAATAAGDVETDPVDVAAAVAVPSWPDASTGNAVAPTAGAAGVAGEWVGLGRPPLALTGGVDSDSRVVLSCGADRSIDVDIADDTSGATGG
jgi:hypothetical protein